jgi:hypothetical protein
MTHSLRLPSERRQLDLVGMGIFELTIREIKVIFIEETVFKGLNAQRKFTDACVEM